MKIAYIILCHKNPQIVVRVAKKLTNKTDNEVFIHVDSKFDIEPFKRYLSDMSHIHFIQERLNIFWGGFSSIEATIVALKGSIKYKCDRYVLLQGMDYPIHSNNYIAEFFEKNKEVEYLKAYNITKSNKQKNYMKCYGYHMFDGVNRNKICLSNITAKTFTMINKLGIRYRKGFYFDNKIGKYELYWGWGHFALTKECVQYIIDFYDDNPKFNKYFRHIFPADETYLQTIVYNSKFAISTFDKGPVEEDDHLTVESMLNLTYFEYPKQVMIIRNINDIKEEIYRKYLFIRKVDNLSNQLLDYLDYKE